MEEVERPRKIQKTEHESMESSQDESTTHPPDNGDQSVDQSEGDGTLENNSKEDATVTATGEKDANLQGITKNQMRKLKRRERWEATKEVRKEKRKEKQVAKRERQKAAKAQQAENGEAADQECRRDMVKRQHARSTLLPLTIVFDCDFDDLMKEKELISLGSQITRSYSDNSRAPFKAHLAISSFNKRLKDRFDNVLSRHHENWKGVSFTGEDYMVAAEQAMARMKEPKGGQFKGLFENKSSASPDEGEVIYLTSDSEETLTELNPYSVYIIGGLVDRNRHKGICYKKAKDRGIKTAKLPIGDYMDMATRFVLATNHVVEIMVRWLELGDWGKAFEAVIPRRKGGVMKNKSIEEDGTQDDETAPADRVQLEIDEVGQGELNESS